MPQKEAPSFNSLRVQKAYRINNIESSRLQRRLFLLHRERMHTLRTNNQEVRQVKQTVVHIEANSGRSPLGLAPKEKAHYARDDLDPTFIYGERQNSRRFGKFRRVQSAFEPNSERRLSNVSEESGLSNRSQRPHTSPVRRLAPVATSFGPVFDEVIQRVESRLDDNQGFDLSDTEKDADVQQRNTAKQNDSNDSQATHSTHLYGTDYQARPVTSMSETRGLQKQSSNSNFDVTKRPRTSLTSNRTRANSQNEITLDYNSDRQTPMPSNGRRSSVGFVEDKKPPQKPQNAFVEERSVKRTASRNDIKHLSKSFSENSIDCDSAKSTPRKDEKNLTDIEEDKNDEQEVKKRHSISKPHARKHPMVDIVNKARMMAAAAKKFRNDSAKGNSLQSDDEAAKSGYLLKKRKSQIAKEFKFSLNNQRKEALGSKIDAFFEKYQTRTVTPDADE